MIREICLTCERTAVVRGLCPACYEAFRKALKNGADEQDLIDAELVAPRKTNIARGPWMRKYREAYDQ